MNHNYSSYTRGCRCDVCRRAKADYQRDLVARRRANGTPDHVHGTFNGYRNYGCRCDRCTEANRLRMAEYLPRVQAQPIPNDLHGKPSTYNNYGCRCGPCTTAYSAYCLAGRRRRAQKAAAT